MYALPIISTYEVISFSKYTSTVKHMYINVPYDKKNNRYQGC